MESIKHYLYLLLALLFGLFAAGCQMEGKPQLPTQSLIKASPFVENSIVDCLAGGLNEDCSVNALMPLGLKTSGQSITVDQIMNITLVESPWMAEQFSLVLEQMPQELLDLFASLSSVVISGELNSSFYAIESASIYLDANVLWQTEEQFNQLSFARKSFTRNQPFSHPQRYYHDVSSDARSRFATQEDVHVVRRYLSDKTLLVTNTVQSQFVAKRSLEDVSLRVFRLLAHELSHGIDFLPPQEFSQLNLNQSLKSQMLLRVPISEQITKFEISAELNALAAWAYQDQARQDFDFLNLGLELQATDLSHLYNAVHSSEDMAMLLEEYFMHKYYNSQAELAFIQKQDNQSNCNDYKVIWGVKHRLANVNISAKKQQIMNRLGFDQLQTTGEETSIPTGRGWCDY